jgi:alkylation response protein AidB-like acyl-CoA dehydrogenase
MATSSPDAIEFAHGDGVSLIDIARSLEPLIREHAEALEDGRIPPPLVAALYDSGVFKAMLPREVGGLEASPVEWLQMIEELARVNASAGWLGFIQSGIGLAFLDPERFERFRVRAGGRLIIAMSLGRIAGKAVRAEGGYRITWDGLGLRGTGSGDFEISDLFVPEEQVNPGLYSAPRYDRALFRIKEMPEMGHGAHALGVASAALESLVQAVSSRPAPGSARQLAMGHVQAHQIAFARADVLIRAARALLHETVLAAVADAESHPELSMELRVRLREANIFAVRAAKEAVGLIFEMAGSSAVYQGRPIEQAFRDISTAANHTNYVDTAYAAIGSYFLTRDSESGPEIAGRPFL